MGASDRGRALGRRRELARSASGRCRLRGETAARARATAPARVLALTSRRALGQSRASCIARAPASPSPPMILAIPSPSRPETCPARRAGSRRRAPGPPRSFRRAAGVGTRPGRPPRASPPPVRVRRARRQRRESHGPHHPTPADRDVAGELVEQGRADRRGLPARLSEQPRARSSSPASHDPRPLHAAIGHAARRRRSIARRGRTPAALSRRRCGPGLARPPARARPRPPRRSRLPPPRGATRGGRCRDPAARRRARDEQRDVRSARRLRIYRGAGERVTELDLARARR